MVGVRDQDDGVLLQALADDEAAFEAFYRRHVRRVSAYAAKRCASPADVADVVAQTFVRLLRFAPQYDPGRGQPLGLLYSIAASTLADHYRAQRRQNDLVHRLAGRDLLDADDVERIESALDAARAAAGAREALRTVPPGESAVLEMVADGASTVQAAQALGISPGTARVRLHRARRRVRSQLTIDGKDT